MATHDQIRGLCPEDSATSWLWEGKEASSDSSGWLVTECWVFWKGQIWMSPLHMAMSQAPAEAVPALLTRSQYLCFPGMLSLDPPKQGSFLEPY